ncbi:transposable element tcb2 transposase [Trichonephila clavata]|uniref:Transposable element tcb2 transposase n=1 Tax=Trichonephila clavata TaxID=2740835 RepID=A0A8X6K5U9_TRICU|nr:transposable element tcb2 transposase [Trichonephila clavata]
MGPLTRLGSTLTGDRYISILSDHLYPFMFIVHSNKFGELQQDNEILHTSRIATEWFQEYSYEFRHFRWTPKSQDMIIIEYIWDALQRAVHKRSLPPCTSTDLWTALQDSWCKLPPALLQTFVKSMSRRVVALLYARGGSTRY